MKRQAIHRYFRKFLILDYRRHLDFLLKEENKICKKNNIRFTFIDYNSLTIKQGRKIFVVRGQKDLAHLQKDILLAFREVLDQAIEMKQRKIYEATILDKLAQMPNILEIVGLLDELEDVRIQYKIVREIKDRLTK